MSHSYYIKDNNQLYMMLNICLSGHVYIHENVSKMDLTLLTLSHDLSARAWKLIASILNCIK